MVPQITTYQPNVVYAPGSDNPADYPSRNPRKQTQTNSREEKIAEEYINFILQNLTPVGINLEEVLRETLNDHLLQRVIESIRNNSWYHKNNQDLRLDNTEGFQIIPDFER